MTLRWTKFIDNPDLPLYNPMKYQNSIDVHENADEKYNRALDLFIESVHKPDNALRSCAHNQYCFNELMEIREDVLRGLHHKRRVKQVKPEPIEPVVNADGSKSYEYAAHVTLTQIAKFQRGSSL